MKLFNELSRTKKIILVAISLFVVAFFLFNDDETDYEMEYSNDYEAGYFEDGGFTNDGEYNSFQEASVNAPTQSNTSGGGKVVIYDKGLQMPVSTMTLPKGWKVEQDIALDPNTARPINYKLEFVGPRGELSKAYMQFVEYGNMKRKSFDQAYQECLKMAINTTMNNVSVGNLVPSQELENNKEFRKVTQKLSAQGMRVTALEVVVTGQRNGQPYSGKIKFGNFIQPTVMGDAGMLMPLAIEMAPANIFEESLATFKKIDDSTDKNTAYEQRVDQINQKVMQQMAIANQQRSAQAAAAHQQRMRSNQQAFDAHQQRMGEMSQMQDASFNNYMNNLRNSGSSNTNGYSSHDAFIDQTYERSTFNDPWSGQEKKMDGQYDYNYTNGLGDYYRTNDPSFDPNSLPGDYQKINPQYPY